MANKKVDFKQVAKIDMERYFGKGKKSLLLRQEDVNTLLLQLAIIVNELSDLHNVLVQSSIGIDMARLKEIIDKKENK